MSYFKHNGQNVGASANNASAVNCRDADGNPSTVQAVLDEQNNKIVDVDDRVKGLEAFDLLWENPNPSDAFVKTTITVPGLENYKMICVQSAYATTQPTILHISTISPVIVNHGAQILCVGGSVDAVGKRQFFIKSNSMILFDDTMFADGKTYNDYLVPQKIYGIK